MVLNSTRGKRERIGRILRMHANKREELTEADAGNIYAAVGLRDTRTGDTLCDEKHPILLEQMIFPEPVISIAIEPKTKADVEKLGVACRSSPTRTRRSASHTNEETGQTIIAAWASSTSRSSSTASSASSRSSRTSASPRSRTARRSRKKVDVRVQVRQAVRRPRPVRPRRSWRSSRASAARASSSRTTSSAASSRRSSSRRSRRASARRWTRGVLAGYPLVDMKVPPLRRQLPRGRLVRGPAFEVAASLCFQDGAKRAGLAPARADHEDRGRRPRAVHGRRHRRPQLAPRAASSA